MRAALYERLGPAHEVLRVAELDEPEPGPGEVRVRVRVSAVNPTDCKVRRAAPGATMPFPYVVPNQDGAGAIDAVGAGVDEGRIGERVWLYFASWQRAHGTAAQWVCLPGRQAVPLPGHASFDLGACLGIPALTAHRALLADGPISGKTVLVAGGAGAVGHYAIELARRAGAGRVLATAGSPERAALASAAGADEVVNYKEEGAARRIRAAAPDGVDRIIEVGVTTNLGLDLDVLAEGGMIVSYSSGPEDPVVPVRRMMGMNAVLRFLLIYKAPPDALAAAVADVTAALEADALTELPLLRFSLDDVADAHQAVDDGAAGKVVIDID